MDGEVLTVEPNIRTLPDTLSGRSNLRLVDLETALTGAGVVVLLAEHREFVDLDPARLEGKTVIDTRGVWRQPAGRR
jgi:UDP-N-acetyl-D-mannosaminuronic acid dehydrogenase